MENQLSKIHNIISERRLRELGFDNYSLFAEGASNLILNVESDQKASLLKVPKRKNGNNNIEAFLLNLFDGKGAPKLFSEFDDGNGNLILQTEKVMGEHYYELSIDDAYSLGKLFQDVHSLDIKLVGNAIERTNCKGFFETRIISQYEKCEGMIPKKYQDELRCVIPGVAEKMDKVISEKSSIVHSDVIPLNVLFRENGCVLIDWELARVAAPEWDIAAIKKSFYFLGDAWNSFLDAYQLPIDNHVLKTVELLHYLNVALWRLCSFFLEREQHNENPIFLKELDSEIKWIQEHLAR